VRAAHPRLGQRAIRWRAASHLGDRPFQRIQLASRLPVAAFEALPGKASHDYDHGNVKRGAPLPPSLGPWHLFGYWRAMHDTAVTLRYLGSDGQGHHIKGATGRQRWSTRNVAFLSRHPPSVGLGDGTVPDAGGALPLIKDLLRPPDSLSRGRARVSSPQAPGGPSRLPPSLFVAFLRDSLSFSAFAHRSKINVSLPLPLFHSFSTFFVPLPMPN